MTNHLFMVGKDESSRWLEACLEWNTRGFDNFFFYDDQSVDDTPRIAARYGKVSVRPNSVPSFMEHEGHFKQAAWEEFQDRCSPSAGDWVMALDCDEFITEPFQKTTSLMSFRDGILRFDSKSSTALSVPIPEVWDVSGPIPKIRVDGYWNTNKLPRYFKYLPDGKYDEKAMGCGCAPTYAYKDICTTMHLGSILHYGYALEEDRVAKYDRYSSIEHGHNETHIESIMATPTLREYKGQTPKVWRGIK